MWQKLVLLEKESDSQGVVLQNDDAMLGHYEPKNNMLLRVTLTTTVFIFPTANTGLGY